MKQLKPDHTGSEINKLRVRFVKSACWFNFFSRKLRLKVQKQRWLRANMAVVVVVDCYLIYKRIYPVVKAN